MIYFEILFPVVMILSPLAILVAYPPTADADMERVRMLRKQLWLKTAMVILAFVGAVTVRNVLAGEGQSPVALGPPWMHLFAFSFFPLWFGCAMPLVMASRPNLNKVHVQGAQRAASLEPRANLRILPRWVQWMPTLLLLAGIGLCIYKGFGTQDISIQNQILVVTVCLVALTGVLAYPALHGYVQQESEPMPPNPDPRLTQAYQNYRSAKAWAIWCVAVLFQLIVIGALAFLLFPIREGGAAGQLAGWIGGIGGSMVGIFGGLFGAWIGMSKSRVQELLGADLATKS